MVELVSTIWNQRWRILLNEYSIKMIKNTKIFKQYEKHLLHAGELNWTLEVHLKKLQWMKRTTHQIRKSYQVHSGGGRSQY